MSRATHRRKMGANRSGTYMGEGQNVICDYVVNTDEKLETMESSILGLMYNVHTAIHDLRCRGITIPEKGHSVDIRFMLMDYVPMEEKADGMKLPCYFEDVWDSLSPFLPRISS